MHTLTVPASTGVSLYTYGNASISSLTLLLAAAEAPPAADLSLGFLRSPGDYLYIKPITSSFWPWAFRQLCPLNREVASVPSRCLLLPSCWHLLGMWGSYSQRP